MERTIFQSALNHCTANIAIVNHAGTIVYVNDNWQRYGQANDGRPDHSGVGVNYFEVCQRAVDTSATVNDIVKGIKSVVSGNAELYQRTYPCHSPLQSAWFNVRVVPLPVGKDRYFMISHEDRTVETLLRNALERENASDSLTGMSNRTGFLQSLQEQWRRDLRTKSEMSLLLVGIDNLVEYASQYGRGMKHDCVSQTARIIHAFARRPNDFASRVADNEYSLVLGGTTQEDALTIAERLRECVESLSIPSSDGALSSVVTVSIGLASITPNRHLSASQLLVKAESALLRCQSVGGNTITL
ncbi:MAG: GGDEF domain-containing protein [Pseudomonadota bacterium]